MLRALLSLLLLSSTASAQEEAGSDLPERAAAELTQGHVDAAKKLLTTCIEEAQVEGDVLARCYFQLGRVAHAEHDKEREATAYYASILEDHRPEVVAALKGVGTTWKPELGSDAPDAPFCVRPRTRDNICACLVAGSREFFDRSSYHEEKRTCRAGPRKPGVAVFEIANHRDHDLSLLVREGRTWAVATHLAEHANRNFQWTETKVTALTDAFVGTVRLVGATVSESTHHEFQGDDEDTVSKVVCALGKGEPKCVEVTVSCEERVAPNDTTREQGPHVRRSHSSTKAELVIAADGTVTATIIKQSPDGDYCHLPDVHEKLW